MPGQQLIDDAPGLDIRDLPTPGPRQRNATKIDSATAARHVLILAAVAGSVPLAYPGVVGEVPITLKALNGSSLVTPPGSALIAAVNCDQAAVMGLPVTWP